MVDEELVSKIYKQLTQLNIQKKKKNQFKKWTEDLNRHFFQRRHTDGQQAHEKCPILLIIRDMQIKMMRYHLTSVRMFIT